MPPKDPPSPAHLPQNPPKKRAGRGRPPKIDSEQLLKVAREVFLERGIRATTAEVAERAGVSEGTLFHRFKTKEGLFRGAMLAPEEEIPELLINAVESISGLEAEEALFTLGEKLLDLGKVALPLMMMTWSNPTNCGGPPERQVPKFRAFVRNLAGFFQKEIDAGRLRNVDAEVTARVFLGSIHHYCMSRIMSPDTSWMVPEGMYLRGLVDLLLRGALPRAEESNVAAQ